MAKIKTRVGVALLFLVCSAIHNTFAQVPGYLGKKRMVGYTASISPVPFYASLLEHLDSYNRNGKKLGLINGFLLKNEIWSEVVVSKAKTIKLTVAQSKTGLAGESNYINYGLPWYPIYSYTKYSHLDVIDVKVSLSKYYFGVAPVGTYTSYSFHYVNKHYTSFIYDQSGSNTGKTNLSLMGFGLSFDYGKKAIYYDCLVVDLCGSFGIIFPSQIPVNIKSDGKKGLFSDPYSRSTLMNCKLSVGYLF